MREYHTVIKWICVSLCVLVGAFLIFFIYRDTQARNAREEISAQYEREIMAYRVELYEAKNALEELQHETSYTSANAELMVGFMISDITDLTYVKEQAATYGFTPVLVVDCTTIDNAVLDAVAETDAAWEIVLHASQISNELTDKLEAVRAKLAVYDRTDTGVFFLRLEQLNARTVTALKENDVFGYTVYHDEPQSGQNADGMIYFDYAYLRTSDVDIRYRLQSCYASKASMLFILDMQCIREGVISEALATSIFTMLESYSREPNCSFSTVKNVGAELSGILHLEAEYAEQAAAEAQKMEERISELEALIEKLNQDYQK